MTISRDFSETYTTRPAMTQEQLAAQAKLMLAGERDHRYSVVNEGLCEMCGVNWQTKRTLCDSCYTQARRVGEENTYPTQSFLRDPEPYVYWLLQYFPDLIEDAALQSGWDVTRPRPEQ